MLSATVKKFFQRDIGKLKAELAAYQKEENLWLVSGDVSNSAGNLCLHLVGNLNHFIGHRMGGTDYVRQREQEFSLKDVPRKELMEQLDETLFVVETTLDKMTEADLEKDFPIPSFNEKFSTGFFLIHLTTHLTYHLGQINYHRRMMDADVA